MIQLAHSIDEAHFHIRENASFILFGNTVVVFRSNYGRDSYDVIKMHEDEKYRAMECPTEDIERVVRIVISSSPAFLDSVGSWRSLSEREVDYVKQELASRIPEAERESEEVAEGPDDEPEESCEDAAEDQKQTPQRNLPGSGWLYILANSHMAGILKIGHTERSPQERLSELSSASGVPAPFVLVWDEQVSNSYAAEQEVHRLLENYRVSDSREFFRLEAKSAIEAVSLVASKFPLLQEAPTRDVDTNWEKDDEALTPEVDTNWERDDELFLAALMLVQQRGQIDPALIRMTLKVSFEDSRKLFEKLKLLGAIDIGGNLHSTYRRQ